jgi:hypothetical protein
MESLIFTRIEPCTLAKKTCFGVSISRPPCRRSMVIVRSDAAISCSSGEEGVVEMIAGAERKKKPWWSPLFDIIREPEPSSFTASSSLSSMAIEAEAETRNVANSSPNPNPNPSPRAARRSGVGFTAEKARLLRKELRATESFHDIMYHSAIASRLAFTDESSSSSAS